MERREGETDAEFLQRCLARAKELDELCNRKKQDPQPQPQPQHALPNDEHDRIHREAEALAKTVVGEHGLLNLHRTRELAQQLSERQFKALLSFVPHPLLLKVHKHAVAEPWHAMLTHEVLNTSLLRSDWKVRRAYLHCANDKIPDLPSSLIPIFDDHGNLKPGLFHSRELTDEENAHPKVPAAGDHSPFFGAQPVHRTLAGFRLALDTFMSGRLARLDFSQGLFIAGGAVLGTLLHWGTPAATSQQRLHNYSEQNHAIAEAGKKFGLPPSVVAKIADMAIHTNHLRDAKRECASHWDRFPMRASDIDVFIIAQSQEHANSVLKCCIEGLREGRTPAFRIVRTANAITVWQGFPNRSVQLMIVMYRTMEEVLSFFDLDCVCVGYDGKNVYAHPRFVRAVNTRFNFVEPAKLRRWCTASRIKKYTQRGFGTLFFELCKHVPRCDVVLSPDTAAEIAKLHAVTTAYRELGYATSHIPYSRRMRSNTCFDQFLQSRLEQEAKMLRRCHVLEDGTVVVESLSVLMTIEGSDSDSDSDIDILPESLEAVPLRWKRTDLWRTGRGNEFLPLCFMCLKRIDPSATHAERPLICRKCEDTTAAMKGLRHDLTNHTALVTGGRVHVGYAVALALLRMGADVIVTSRFPRLAAANFTREPDFEEWRARLRVFGLDFVHLSEVSRFVRFIEATTPRIDILINNAHHQAAGGAAGAASLAMQERHAPQSPLVRVVPAIGPSPPGGEVSVLPQPLLVKEKREVPVHPINPLHNMDAIVQAFNNMRVGCGESGGAVGNEDVAVGFAETQLVNSLAPFALVSGLQRCLANRDHSRPGFVVNVVRHFHSQIDLKPNAWFADVAKAGLNMVTRTLCESFVHDHVFVTSVELAWNMNPDTVNAGTPLLPTPDSAARVLQPVLEGLRSGKPRTGVLLRNFEVVCW